LPLAPGFADVAAATTAELLESNPTSVMRSCIKELT